MTRTAQALVIGPVVGLGSWAMAVGAVQDEPTPLVVNPIAARPRASGDLAETVN